MNQPTQATVIFLRDQDGRICLARKKQPIHHTAGEIGYSLGTYNGYGGKRELSDISIEDAAIRELYQEAEVLAIKTDLIPSGHVSFFWPHNTGSVADMEVYFYFLEKWQGEPKEGTEMGPPEFFMPNMIPYEEMMPGDKVIIPKMLTEKYINGAVYLGKKEEQGNATYVPSPE